MPLLSLVGQCASIFVASFVVGSLPLLFRSAMSGKTLKAVSVFGMGLLVGAALTIIIPEGVSTLVQSAPSGGERVEGMVQAIGLSLLTGFGLMLLIESLTPHPPHASPESPPDSPDESTTPLQRSARNSDEGARPRPEHLDSRSPIVPKRMHVRDVEGKETEHNSGKSGIAGLNATLGLVIHGAADGIALGASSLSGKGNLSLIVFIAVLVHKGPTALGLTTTLWTLGLDPVQIRKRLIIFSFAAPLGAILMFSVASLFGGANIGTGSGSSEVDGLMWWTGIALLFSGGSFLYVATVIQPLSNPDPHQHSHSGHAQAETENKDQPLGKYARTALLVGGMVLPALLGYIVGDDH